MKWNKFSPYDDEEVTIIDKVMAAVVMVMVVVGLAMMLTSCRSEKTVVASHVQKDSSYIKKTDTCYVWKSIVDTTVVKDSIVMKMVGDTVWKEKWHNVLKYINQTDTVYKNSGDVQYVCKTDSIPYVVEVEKELSWWQRFRLNWFDKVACLTLLLGGAVAWLVWMRLKQ